MIFIKNLLKFLYKIIYSEKWRLDLNHNIKKKKPHNDVQFIVKTESEHLHVSYDSHVNNMNALVLFVHIDLGIGFNLYSGGTKVSKWNSQL